MQMILLAVDYPRHNPPIEFFRIPLYPIIPA
jgi:hypothetical protein